MTVKYRKTKQGEWVAFGRVSEVHVGTVLILKADGTTKTETVARLGHVFDVNGSQMVYGYLAAAAKTASSTANSGQCDECGDRTRSLRPCRDSSGIDGMCCGQCASQPSYTLSFM